MAAICAKRASAVARESLQRDRPGGLTSPAFHAYGCASPFRACTHSNSESSVESLHSHSLPRTILMSSATNKQTWHRSRIRMPQITLQTMIASYLARLKRELHVRRPHELNAQQRILRARIVHKASHAVKVGAGGHHVRSTLTTQCFHRALLFDQQVHQPVLNVANSLDRLLERDALLCKRCAHPIRRTAQRARACHTKLQAPVRPNSIRSMP